MRQVTAAGTLNLLSQSCGEYNINQDGLSRRTGNTPGSGMVMGDSKDVHYKCSASEMRVFEPIGKGASSVEKRQQMLNEIRMLCEAKDAPGLVSFYGAFFLPDSGQISIALELVDGGSLADVLVRAGKIPENLLARIAERVLQGLSFLHSTRHLVHRDIKPANILMNLAGEAKISDFGISAGLDTTMAMCATFVGTVTYMSPERINNAPYSYPADIWSLGLTLLECATGVYPYNATGGPLHLMLQVMNDPSPEPPAQGFSPELRLLIAACLLKDPSKRPTAEQASPSCRRGDLLRHPFVLKYAQQRIDLAAYVSTVFDSTEALTAMAQMFAGHFYAMFDSSPTTLAQLAGLYKEESRLTYAGDAVQGVTAIMHKLAANYQIHCAFGNLTHVMEHVDCTPYSSGGMLVLVSGRLRGNNAMANNQKFSEVFVLMPSQSPTFWICNQMFRLL
eukprot:jgi/Chlat1/8727/Chrsp9S00720